MLGVDGGHMKLVVGTAGLELEAHWRRERVAAGDEREPPAEILSRAEGSPPGNLGSSVRTAGLELEPFCGRERVTTGDEWEPAGEILSAAKDLRVDSFRGYWWALQDSNLRPRACEARALTN